MQKCQNKLTNTLKLQLEFELMSQILFPPPPPPWRILFKYLVLFSQQATISPLKRINWLVFEKRVAMRLLWDKINWYKIFILTSDFVCILNLKRNSDGYCLFAQLRDWLFVGTLEIRSILLVLPFVIRAWSKCPRCTAAYSLIVR